MITNIFFGSGPDFQQIHLDDVRCSSGEEQSLLECLHSPIGVTNCEHPEDVGIICQRSEGDYHGCRVIDTNPHSKYARFITPTLANNNIEIDRPARAQ